MIYQGSIYSDEELFMFLKKCWKLLIIYERLLVYKNLAVSMAFSIPPQHYVTT